MIFPITSITVIGCMVAVWSVDTRRSGVLLGLGVWGMSLLLAALPVLDYTFPYSVRADGFVALCLAALTGAYLMCRRRMMTVDTGARVGAESRDADIGLAVRLAVIGIAGNILLVVD